MNHNSVRQATTGNRYDLHDGGDVIDIFIADHEKIRGMLQQILRTKSDEPRRKKLADRITAEVALHTEAEEMMLYLALKRKLARADESTLNDEMLKAYVEHGSMNELVAQLACIDPSEKLFMAILEVMNDQVERQIDQEEATIFKQARMLLTRQELIDIGQEVIVHKQSAVASKLAMGK